MLPRRARFVSVQILIMIATAASAFAQAAPALAVDGLGKGTVSLDGPWQFHLGDNPAWAAPAFDDSRWEQLAADKPWGAQGHESYTGFAWYRCRISLTPAPGASPEFDLIVPRVDDAYEVYWNGTLVGRHGKLPPHPVWYDRKSPQTFELGQARSGVLAMRVWKAPLLSIDNGRHGGMEAPPVVGSPGGIATYKTTLDYQWLRNRQFLYAQASLYGLVALLSLLGWLRDRKQWLPFWMAGFSLAPQSLVLLYDFSNTLPFAYSGILNELAWAIRNISLWFLLLWLLDLHEDRAVLRLTKVAAVVRFTAAALAGLLYTIGWTSESWTRYAHIGGAVQAALFGLLGVLEAYPLVLVVFAVAVHRHLDAVRWLVAISAFFAEMIDVVRFDVMLSSRYTHWTFAERITAPLFTLNGSPISVPDLTNTLLLVSIVYAVYRYLDANSRRQSALEQELRSARELQQLLIPEIFPEVPGFTLTSAYRPDQEVGGDFFQIVPLEGGSTLVILGDVSGKGLKAAMAVSLIVGAIHVLADEHPDPAQLLTQLNRSLHSRLQGGFATCVALRLEAGGRCAIASAGHPAPFLNDQELALPGALPLGLALSAGYEETILQLSHGDRLALYTDGMLEARNQSGELYGFERLETLFATRPNAEQATKAAIAFGQDDDITVLTLTRLETALA